VKLSVIVPFYRAEPFVSLAIENLSRHADRDVEFVLVEDCSGDRTLDALRQHSVRLPGARIIERQNNGGLAAARNTGLAAATGRYVTFLDADDWYGPRYLGQLLASIEHFGCDFVRVDHVQVHGRRRTIARSPEGRRDEVFSPRDSILPSERSSGIDYPYAWAGIFDIERLGADLMRFDDGLHTCEDRPWLWRLYLTADSHAVTGLNGLFYRRNVAGSLTDIGDRRQLHFIDAFDQIIAELAKDPDAEQRYLHKAVRSYCAITAHHLRAEGRFPPELRDELRRNSSKAMHRLPAACLHEVFAAMADRRVSILQRLMRRYGP
jgi:glycosyltransferase involved in cell wall biosynthesis